MNYEEMTNAELKAICAENDYKIVAKKATQPTQAELLVAIENGQAAETEVVNDSVAEGEGYSEPEEIQEEEVMDSFAKAALAASEKLMTPEAKLAQAEKKANNAKAIAMKKKLMKLTRVTIIDNQMSQTHKVKNAVQFVGWGNRVVGYHNERIILNKPWHVREGALINLRAVTMQIPIQNDEANRIDWEDAQRYSITELEPLTKDQIELINKKQNVREQALNL